MPMNSDSSTAPPTRSAGRRTPCRTRRASTSSAMRSIRRRSSPPPITAASSPTSTTSSATSPSTRGRNCSGRITGSSIPATTRRRSSGSCGERSPGAGLARRDPQPRQGRIASTGSTRRSCRSSTVAASRGSTSRFAATSPHRKLAEAQLREQAALTNLGQLTAVVAHEVRNPLAGLRASLQVLERRCADARDRDIVAAMVQRIDELNDKVEDLLLYARPKPPRLQAVDVGALVREVGAQRAGRPPGACVRRSTVSGGDGVTASGRRRHAPRRRCSTSTMNACQAAGRRPVEIQIVQRAGVCRIAVRDRGPGIPAGCARADVRAVLHDPGRRHRPRPGDREATDRAPQRNGRADRSPGGGTVAEIGVPRATHSTRPEPATTSPLTRRYCRPLVARAASRSRPRRSGGKREHQRVQQAQHPVGHRSHARAEAPASRAAP